MSTPAPKLEDFLNHPAHDQKGAPDLLEANFENFELNNQPVDTSSLTNVPQASFEELLDFTLPSEEISGKKITQVGEVVYIGDGVCKVRGIDDVQVEDILTIKTQYGDEQTLVLGIDEKSIETVVMGDYTNIKHGDEVVSRGNRLSIPAGPSLLGRVIDPLGRPLDGKGAVKGAEIRDIEFPAPSVMARKNIYEPMHTGIMVVDTTIPVGRGQRELVIGDRKTGKTRTVLDAICNQKGQNVICVYVGVGIQAAKAKDAVQLLESRGAMEYTTVVVSLSDQPPTLQYIAPYSGVALLEHFMYQGKHCLIAYDDLSKQAKAYRQVSLLLKRSPGRDAYPGDIFFLHSRLLERAAKLNEKLGEGSITALPVAQTVAGDVSEYIITNLMSITDGHIYLDANLMHEGIMPAVNSGLSVSRIGGKVQSPLLRKVGELAGRQLTRYEEVKSFETINTEVAEDTLRDIKRGKRVKEMFAHDSKYSLSDDEEVLLMALVTSGRLDSMELEEMSEFKNKFIDFYRELNHKEYKQKAVTSEKMEEVDGMIDEIYAAYQKANPSTSSYVVPST